MAIRVAHVSAPIFCKRKDTRLKTPTVVQIRLVRQCQPTSSTVIKWYSEASAKSGLTRPLRRRIYLLSSRRGTAKSETLRPAQRSWIHRTAIRACSSKVVKAIARVRWKVVTCTSDTRLVCAPLIQPYARSQRRIHLTARQSFLCAALKATVDRPIARKRGGAPLHERSAAKALPYPRRRREAVLLRAPAAKLSCLRVGPTRIKISPGSSLESLTNHCPKLWARLMVDSLCLATHWWITARVTRSSPFQWPTVEAGAWLLFLTVTLSRTSVSKIFKCSPRHSWNCLWPTKLTD